MQRLSGLLSSSAHWTARPSTIITSSTRLFVASNVLTSRRVGVRLQSNMRSFVSPLDNRRYDAVLDQLDRVKVMTGEDNSPEARWQKISKEAVIRAKNEPPAHAYSGRTVEIKPDSDLAAGFRQLDGILGRNSVRYTLRMTERHEKSGVKRRRLSSERWRKRFANEVKKKVQLVMKMRDRGA